MFYEQRALSHLEVECSTMGWVPDDKSIIFKVFFSEAMNATEISHTVILNNTSSNNEEKYDILHSIKIWMLQKNNHRR